MAYRQASLKRLERLSPSFTSGPSRFQGSNNGSERTLEEKCRTVHAGTPVPRRNEFHNNATAAQQPRLKTWVLLRLSFRPGTASYTVDAKGGRSVGERQASRRACSANAGRVISHDRLRGLYHGYYRAAELMPLTPKRQTQIRSLIYCA